MTHKLTLASTSDARKALLERLAVSFDIVSPNIVEGNLDNESASDKSIRLARKKATACTTNDENHWFLGSDQVALLDEVILSKPYTTENAFTQIKQCLGRSVVFFTSVALSNGSITLDATTEFNVTFRSDLTDTQILSYIQRDNPLWCAGSFKAESLGIALFDEMCGSDVTSLIGLPLIETRKLLERVGFHVL